MSTSTTRPTRSRPARHRTAAAAMLIALGVSPLTGCRLDISRVKRLQPLDLRRFEDLEEGETTLAETLEDLGAPHRVEWNDDRNYLWYFHEDYTRFGIRFELPTSIFNLGFASYNPVALDGTSETTNTISLVFDEGNVLQQKSLRLSDAYRELADEEPSGWSFHVIPRGGISPILLGDGGEEDFTDLFEYGALAGLELGVTPVPVLMLFVGGNYQRYFGDRFTTRGLSVELDDLELYQVEVGGRLQFPVGFFTRFWRFEEVKKLFYSEDIRILQGAFLYLRWTLNATYNEEVEAEVNGQESGVYFEQTLGFSSTFGAGFEYRIGRFALHLEAVYQTLEEFDDNNDTVIVDTDADRLESFIFGGGFNVRF